MKNEITFDAVYDESKNLIRAIATSSKGPIMVAEIMPIASRVFNLWVHLDVKPPFPDYSKMTQTKSGKFIVEFFKGVIPTDIFSKELSSALPSMDYRYVRSKISEFAINSFELAVLKLDGKEDE